MKAIFIALSTMLILTQSCNVVAVSNVAEERWAANTCGDPSLSEVFLQGFSPSTTLHVLRPQWPFIVAATEGVDFEFQGEIFRAWETVQTGTVPLNQLSTPSGSDRIYLPSLNGTVPTVAGFTFDLVTGFVYPTQICNSIPLFDVSQPSFTDHWYTTSTTERDSMVANGWVDGGVVAFVLPVNIVLVVLDG